MSARIRLDNQRPFEFGNRANEGDEHPSQWSARVHCFAYGYGLDSEVVQFIDDFEKVLRAAGNAVKSCNQQQCTSVVSAK
jgi:hypothetical protein